MFKALNYLADETAAIEALEKLEKTEFHNSSIEYLAIVKSSLLSTFYIERGYYGIKPDPMNFTGDVIYKDKVDIPIKTMSFLDKILGRKTKSIRIRDVETSKFYFYDGDKSKKEDSRILMGGISIGNTKVTGGTLGGIFTLKGKIFEGRFFGISNWHVLGYQAKKGDPIIHPGHRDDRRVRDFENRKCGVLSWECLDDYREVGFVEFDSSFFDHKSKMNACGYKLSGQVKKAEYNELVRKCGEASECRRPNPNSPCLRRKIYSSNTTIKVHQPSFGKQDIKIFKNQILVKNFSEKGDSGSLMVNENGDAVGLIFANNSSRELTVANDLTLIFNHKFPNKPNNTILVNGDNIPVEQFTLDTIF